MYLRATWCIHCKCFFVSWSCLRAVRERRGREEGERSGCRGKRRLCLMRSHPGNPMTPPIQSPPPPPPSFHLAPSECAHPLKPPPPPIERAVRGAESRNTHPGSCYSAAAKGRQARHTRRQKHKTRTWKRKRLGCEFLRGWVEKHTATEIGVQEKEGGERERESRMTL